jgi:alkylation response protein AidB-like acyl-CoA dehydrogenase
VPNDEQLGRFRERALVYDRENRFFDEDFEEPRDAGYPLMPVPEELGGRGMRLAAVAAAREDEDVHRPVTAELGVPPGHPARGRGNVLDMEAAGALLDRTTREYTDGVDNGPLCGPELASTKCHVVEAAWRVAYPSSHLRDATGQESSGDLR